MKLMAGPENTVEEVLAVVKCSKTTLYRYVGPNGERRQFGN